MKRRCMQASWKKQKIRARVVLDQSNVTQLDRSWVNFLNLLHCSTKNCDDCGLIRTFTVLLQRTHTQASFPLRGGVSQNKRCAVHLTPENGDCVRWGGAWLAWHGAGVSFLWHRFSLLCRVFPGCIFTHATTGGWFSGSGQRKNRGNVDGRVWSLPLGVVQCGYSIEQARWMYSTLCLGGTSMWFLPIIVTGLLLKQNISLITKVTNDQSIMSREFGLRMWTRYGTWFKMKEWHQSAGFTCIRLWLFTWDACFASQCLLVWTHEVSLELCLAYQHERAWIGLLERACSSMCKHGWVWSGYWNKYVQAW